MPKEDLTNKVAPATITQDDYNAEMANIALKSARLELLQKEANLQDLQERLAERNLVRDNIGQRAKTNGETIKILAHNRTLIQTRCNHHKGGNGADGLVAGQGDDVQYAVLKHKMSNGDIWVRCLRCGKWWTPPIEDDYSTKEGYEGALREYMVAVNFTTRNVMSTSVPFRWGDNGKFYRETLRNTTNT